MNNKTKSLETITDFDLEELALAIVKVARSLDGLKKSPLKTKTVAVLIKAMPGMSEIGLREIETILENASELESFHLKDRIALERLGR